MAVPLSVIIKKLGLTAATNKKGRKIIVGIILGTLFLLSTPAMVLLGLFSGSMNIQTNGRYTRRRIGTESIRRGYNRTDSGRNVSVRV